MDHLKRLCGLRPPKRAHTKLKKIKGAHHHHSKIPLKFHKDQTLLCWDMVHLKHCLFACVCFFVYLYVFLLKSSWDYHRKMSWKLCEDPTWFGWDIYDLKRIDWCDGEVGEKGQREGILLCNGLMNFIEEKSWCFLALRMNVCCSISSWWPPILTYTIN